MSWFLADLFFLPDRRFAAGRRLSSMSGAAPFVRRIKASQL